ncbi:MAG: tyrosine--tRNA ligase, partial [Candidatus Taylorbacteria bacterium]
AGDELSSLLLESGFVESKSDWRRLVEEGAVHFVGSNEKITDPKYQVIEEMELRIGKKRFVRIRVK